MTAPSNPPGFRDHVGLSIDDASDGRASATLEVRPEHLNAHGSVHGGAIATLCDSAMGTALAASGTERPVTVDLTVTFLAPAGEGLLVAEARVRKRGKRILVVEAEVTQADETVALASATFTDAS